MAVKTDQKELRIMRTFSNLVVCLFFVLTMISCNKQTVYHSYQSLPNDGWKKSDTLSFQIENTDSIPHTIHLFAEVRNKNNYPYQNLSLSLYHNLQDSAHWKRDTISLNLTDKAGNWIGTGCGNLYQSSKFIGSIVISQKGNHRIKVIHRMTDDRLIGLSDIGIKVSR